MWFGNESHLDTWYGNELHLSFDSIKTDVELVYSAHIISYTITENKLSFKFIGFNHYGQFRGYCNFSKSGFECLGYGELSYLNKDVVKVR